MSKLHDQAIGIIDTCKTALLGNKAGDKHPVDNQTIALAQAILEQAKVEVPGDKILAAVSLKPPIHIWTVVLSAMEIVVASLPGDGLDSWKKLGK